MILIYVQYCIRSTTGRIFRSTINPRIALPYAYRNGADFVIAGMFDFQVETDVKIAVSGLQKLKNRNRPWQG